MPKVRSTFLTVHLWLCVHPDTYLMPSGQEERCGLWSQFVLWCLNEWTACESKFTSTVRSSEQLCHRSPQFSAVDRALGFHCLFPRTWGKGWIPPVAVRPLSCRCDGPVGASWARCCRSPWGCPFSCRSCPGASWLQWQWGRVRGVPPRRLPPPWPGWPQRWDGWAPAEGRRQEEPSPGGSASCCCGPGRCAGCLFLGCFQPRFPTPAGVCSWFPSSSGSWKLPGASLYSPESGTGTPRFVCQGLDWCCLWILLCRWCVCTILDPERPRRHNSIHQKTEAYANLKIHDAARETHGTDNHHLTWSAELISVIFLHV